METHIKEKLETTEQSLVLLRTVPSARFSVLSESLLNDLATTSSDVPTSMIAVRRPRFSDVPMTPEMAARLNIDLDTASPEDVETFFKVSYVDNLTRMMLDEAIDTSASEPALNPVLAAPAPETEVMFVVTKAGKLVFGVRPKDVRRPHPTLVDEDDPEVLNGGTITMLDGLIHKVRDDSGHFQPSQAGFEALLRAFSAMPSSTFHPDFQGFKPFGSDPVVPEWTETTDSVKARVAYGALRNDARLLVTAIQARMDGDRKILTNDRIVDKRGALNTALNRHRTAYDMLLNLLRGVISFVDAYHGTVGDVLDGISLPGAKAYAERTIDTASHFIVRDGDAGSEAEARDFIAQNHELLDQILKELRALP